MRVPAARESNRAREVKRESLGMEGDGPRVSSRARYHRARDFAFSAAAQVSSAVRRDARTRRVSFSQIPVSDCALRNPTAEVHTPTEQAGAKKESSVLVRRTRADGTSATCGVVERWFRTLDFSSVCGKGHALECVGTLRRVQIELETYRRYEERAKKQIAASRRGQATYKVVDNARSRCRNRIVDRPAGTFHARRVLRRSDSNFQNARPERTRATPGQILGDY